MTNLDKTGKEVKCRIDKEALNIGYQGHMQRDALQIYPPQQSYGPQRQGERRDPMPMSNMDYVTTGRDPYQKRKERSGAFI